MTPLSPLLYHHHPFGQKAMANRHLPAMTEVFAPLGAPEGAAIGLELRIMLIDGVPISLAPAKILLSGGPGHQPTSLDAADALGRDDMLQPLRIALNAPMLTQDMSFQWNMISDFQWADSHFEGTYDTRTLWVFPEVAVLLNNIRAHDMSEWKQLRWLAVLLYEQPASRHGVMTRMSQINELLALASTACVPLRSDEWPLGAPLDHMPFRKVGPSDIKLANGLHLLA